MDNGIYTDLSLKDYHSNTTHISATSIKEAKMSLKQFKWFRSGKMPRKQAPHFDFGNAFELALLDHANFEKQVAILQSEYWIAKALEEKPNLKQPNSSKVYKDLQTAFLAENKGKYIVPDKGEYSYEAIEAMLESCYSDQTIKKLISGTEYQLSLFWTDPESGLNLKTRPDICKRKKNVIVNLKTAVDGSPKAFTKDLVNYDYPLQACVEIQGCIQSGLMSNVDNYFWLVCEKTPPYNATIYEFDKSDIAICMDEYYYLVNKIARAQREDYFPGYQDQADNKYGILQAFIPPYYKSI